MKSMANNLLVRHMLIEGVLKQDWHNKIGNYKEIVC